MQISNVMPDLVLVVRHELREGGIARRPQGNSTEVAYAVATADLDKCGGVRVCAASVKVGYGLRVPIQLAASKQITAGAVALLRGDDDFDFARVHTTRMTWSEDLFYAACTSGLVACTAVVVAAGDG